MRRSLSLVAFLVFLLPIAFTYAANLININTADVTLLDTLPGIGPSKAQAIIDYRTEHGSFVRIEDIQNVSGIGPSTYADIAPLITVGEATAPTAPDSVASSTPESVASTTPEPATESVTGGGTAEYLPVPTLHIIENVARTVSSGADIAFSASVYDGKGNKRDDAVVGWVFGDGMRRVGADVYHQYYNSGEYLVVVRATTHDGGNVQKEMTVTVKDASITIVDVTPRGIALLNNDSRTLDLSLWRLAAGGQEFKIPEDTQILAGRTILVSPKVSGLPITGSASLLYPSGEVAAVYPTRVVVQPVLKTAGYIQVQSVEPIISTRTIVQSHEEAALAPAATTELAAAGAPLSFALAATESAAKSRASGLFSSPWTFGLLGVIALAGAAFILL